MTELTPSSQFVKTPPTNDPVALQHVMDRLNIDIAEDKSDLQRLIEEATEYGQLFQTRSWTTQTRVVKYDCFPRSNQLSLRYGPIQYIKSVTLHLADGTDDIIYLHNPDDTDDDIGTADYYLGDMERRGALVLGYDKQWDTRQLRPTEGIEIEYVCGYGDQASNIPKTIRNGIVEYVRHFYLNDGEGNALDEAKRQWFMLKVYSL